MKIFNTEQSAILIVTRHAGLVTFLRRLGYTGPVVEHATAEDVRRRVVIGVLPLHLAAEAAAVGSVVMELPREKRGQELSVEEVEEFFDRIDWFVVRTLDGQQKLLDDSCASGHQGGNSVLAGTLPEEVRGW
jgi:hypothetical protein